MTEHYTIYMGVNLKRTRSLNNKPIEKGAVVYWMQREHRAHDNWALLYAQQLAEKNAQPLIVVFCLRKAFANATERLISFMFDGLAEVSQTLREKNIPFNFLLGSPVEIIPEFLQTHKAGLLITDFHSLKTERRWRKEIAEIISVSMIEVDARNSVPCWLASPKQEFGAYTIRPKIHRLLPEFLDEFPPLKKQTVTIENAPPINWPAMYSQIKVDTSVKKVTWIKAGEKAAQARLEEFIENKLPQYAEDRNDPNKEVQSQLSSYLHFGHISSQRIALILKKHTGNVAAREAFLEELIVRRELADNYCYYCSRYDSFAGFPVWSQQSLTLHLNDKREFVYSREILERAETHDPLWNAAQQEAIKRGIMHGWMRMYWCKKILEWSASPQEAQANAIYLMDKYFLDGREPNGFTGIAWSVGGVHDRAWFDRTIFGKVRYMNFNGAQRKFDVEGYIRKINEL